MPKDFKILLILFSVFISCIREDHSVQEGESCFTAVVENLSSDDSFKWKSGDLISINGYLYRTEEGGMKASFAPVGQKAPEAAEYLAVYPANLDVYGKGIKGTLSQEISVNPHGNLPEDALVSIAKSTTRSLIFRNIYSYLSVDVQTEGVNKMTILSNGGEVLSGNYSVDYSDKNPIVFIPKGQTEISVVSSDGKAFKKGVRVHIPLLPCTLKNGFDFSAQFDSLAAASWQASVTSTRTLQRGKNTEIGKFHYDHNTGEGSLEISTDVDVVLDPDNCLDTPVSELLFGSFSEMHGGDLVPGICEQYIVNPSFEEWIDAGQRGESKNELVFINNNAVEKDPDMAYPWEKRIVGSEASVSVCADTRFNTYMSQKVEVRRGSGAAILQRLALPLYRTERYKVRLYAKALGDVSIKVSFHGVGAKEADVLSQNMLSIENLNEQWTEYEQEFVLSSSTSLFNNRYRQYYLWLEFSGEGTAYVDQVTLFPSDCIDGIFNPETVRYFKEYNIKSIRWPGGNFTSGYNWKNGIGPREDRPSLYNRAWGGVDSNILGIDELMRFCELTGAEPVIGVGYNQEILSEQDIADWVEYCNGPISSPYGAKRASNGHHEPYNIKYWGIGNEVYGTYQLGHVGAQEYLHGLSSIVLKIKAIDNDLVIMASGRGVHNQYRNNYEGWTETISKSSACDILDCHLYVYGYDQSSQTGLTAEQYYRIYAAANLYLRDFICCMREIAPEKKLAFLEWGVLPKLSGNSYVTPQRQTFANMLLSACQYHEMIRNSDVVHMAAMHNFSFYVAPQQLHSEPVNMRTDLFRELAPLAGGRNIDFDSSGFPTYSQTMDMADVGMRENCPEIDLVAVRKDGFIYLSCVNRSIHKEFNLDFDLINTDIEGSSGRIYTCQRPFERSLWSSPIYSSVSQVSLSPSGAFTVPPMSYSIVKLKVAYTGNI